MRIDKIRLSGFTTYKEEQTLNLAALGPGIIAVAGPNGSGKTTLLEAIPGAIYRQMPSRGSVATVAIARDAQIELTGENGIPFTVRLDVDAHNGRQEAVAIDGAGEPLAGPKVKDFDRFIAEHFPPLDVYMASFFASQTGVGSVLKMSRSDRRELFGQLLGLERLEQIAVAAREKARATESEMATSRAALEAIRSGAEDVATLEAQLQAAKDNEAKAAAASRAAGEKLKAVTAERDRLAAAIADAERAVKVAQEARKRAVGAKDALARLEAQVRALEPVLARAGEIRETAAKIKELTAEMERVRVEGETASSACNKATGDLAGSGRALEAARRRLLDATRARTDAEARAKEMCARMEAAVKATAGMPCAGALEDEARSACPALIGHFETRDEAKRYLAGHEKNRFQLEAAEGRAAVDLKTAEAGYAKATDELERLSAELGVQRDKYKEIRAKVDGLKAKDQSAQLDRAEAEKAGLQGALATARTSAAETSAEAEKLEAAAVPVDPAAIRAAQEAVDLAGMDRENLMQEAAEANDQAVRLEVQLGTAREARAKADALVAKLAPMEAELADWRWLGRGLGREGVQALELDAAGPRVSGLANELLADAYGARFQVRLETQAALANGKGVKETFDVVVVDTERGREGNGEDLSGGEKVIVGEALGLAIGLFHAQAAGVNLGTVVRDETVGALDPENAERYMSMLRSFLRVGHVHNLLFVAHNPAIIDLADAVVRVEDGHITVGA